MKSSKTQDDRERLRRRLNRLGKKTSKRVKPPKKRDAVPSEDRLGQRVDTPHGPAYLIEERLPLAHGHGNRKLRDYLGYDAQLAARVAQDSGLAKVDPTHLMFVDTETTGLVGGAGTIAFLIGVGTFEQKEFVLRQFLLHEPGEEAAMLHLLESYLGTSQGFISFNGRVFDLPLVEMRFRMGLRKNLSITSWPHFDLLFPARRLWRRELPDCSLGTLEKHILGVRRTDQDVPGEWIPGMYLEYLRTGDSSEIQRVVYHNMVDILSLVGLSVEILNRHDSGSSPQLSGSEALGVARWHESDGREEFASDAFKMAVASDEVELKVEALRYWTAYLKRNAMRKDAVSHWKEWHQLAPEDPRPCIELAKYYEWQIKDLKCASDWTQSALVCLSHWPEGWRRDQTWDEIKHRIDRIERKLSSSQ